MKPPHVWYTEHMFSLFLLLRLMLGPLFVCKGWAPRGHNRDAGMQPNRFWLGFHAKRFVRRLVARYFSRHDAYLTCSQHSSQDLAKKT